MEQKQDAQTDVNDKQRDQHQIQEEIPWLIFFGVYVFILVGLGFGLYASALVPTRTEAVKIVLENSISVGVLVVIIIHGVIYYRQTQTLNEQLKLTTEGIRLAEQSSIYANRAYVVAKIRDVGKRDSSLQFRLKIENSGNTPANNVSISYRCELRTEPPWNVYAGQDDTPEQVVFDAGYEQFERYGVIAPNGSYHVLTTPESFFKPPNGFSQFTEGRSRFYCWGRIVYEDIFNHKRHTDFCFYQSQKRVEGYPANYGNETF